MAVRWGLCLMWVCAWAFFQMDRVDAAPGLLSELLQLMDSSVGTPTPGADEAEIRIPSTEDSQSENYLLQEPPSPPDGQMDLDNECIFPFTFGNEKHFDCVDHPLLYSWCSLSEIYNGKWKYCTDDDHARCVFPFTYKGHVFNSCITLGSVFRMAWCSLSPNYDQDHAWKYCY